ncbi:uncharacterized protein [Arachis hypogaea]|uniref:uncharacterized protein n=1 Tax=Arachis hypogaea TaxID=3818 RepID=UPI003B210DF9
MSSNAAASRLKRINILKRKKALKSGNIREELLDILDPSISISPVDDVAADHPLFAQSEIQGKIQLPFLERAPDLLVELINGIDAKSRHFQKNIRSYNSMFAFTSFGGKILNSINDGSGPPQFIVTGQNYHRIGSLLPNAGEKPKFAQLYVYDTAHEVTNRQSIFSHTFDIDTELIVRLLQMIDEHNVIAKSFRRVQEFHEYHPSEVYSLRLFCQRRSDRRVYNFPSCDEIATLIVGDFDSSDQGKDIILRSVDGQLRRIYENHPLYWPLQYPLLFPYGEDGFKKNIPYRGVQNINIRGRRTKVSLREFICFRLQMREIEESIIHKSRRLFQQFIVDSFSMVESQRLYEIRQKQNTIRREFLNGIEEAMQRGDIEASSIGTRVILPSSFTGGKRYMFNNCQDAMAICKHFGYPDLFMTMTCNPNWSEFQRYTSIDGIPIVDHPDISCRVFHAKLKCLLTDLKDGVFFGPLNAGMYTIEFQKRGLPHAHIVLWLDGRSRLQSIEIIDELICAELPNPTRYPQLYDVVTKFMIHGPCGQLRFNSPCMRDGRCSKFYPKRFSEQTSFDEDGYPIYRRRDLGVTYEAYSVQIDNRFVVPYNPLLLMKYRAHINLEFCNKSNVIKYLFKYVNKGPDRVTATVSNVHVGNQNTRVLDEIKEYFDCRYLSPCESVWRIFAYDIHHRWPSIQRLTFHLPNQQHIIFDDRDTISSILVRNKELVTMFIAWMLANRVYLEGKDLTYVEFPRHFVYIVDNRE